MRIEITIEGQEPVIHQLVKEKTVVGSGSDCDIQVEADGVSRKHTIIFAKDDSYSVVDQGSTNGTFINEDRLVPGQRADFTSFFPVKIGHLVTMSLLPDEEGAPKFDLAKTIETKKVESSAPRTNPASSAPKTLSSSLNDSFKSSGSRSGAKSGTKTGLKTTAAPSRSASGKTGPGAKKPELDKSDQARMRNSLVIAVMVLIGGVAYFFFKQSEEAQVQKVAEAQVTAPVAVPAPKMSIQELRIKDRVPTDTMGILNYLAYPKCGLELEKALCDDLKLPLEAFPGTGIRREGETIQMVLPYLASEEMFETIGVNFGWMEIYRTQMAQYSDPRHVIDFYFTHVNPAKWAALVEGAAWVEVAFITRDGKHQGDIWFVGTKVLEQNFTSGTLPHRMGLMRKGQLVLDHASGYFRKIASPVPDSAESTEPSPAPETLDPTNLPPTAL